MKNSKSICVFDICGTLFYSNTTFDYVRYYHKARNNYLRWIVTCILMSIIGKACNRLFSLDIRKFILSTLKGESKEDLDLVAFAFYENYLEDYKNLTAFDIFKNAIQDGSVRVLLISASIEPVVSAIASKLNVDYKATQLTFDINNNCLGTIERDNAGVKQKFVGTENVRLVVTDNLDDLELCKLSQQVIIFSKKKNLSYWYDSFKGNTMSYKVYEC